MSKKRTLCKFFSHGACLKGEFCEFSHEWKAPANNICTFYQKGACLYGSWCRYEHVKVSHYLPSDSSQRMLSGSISCGVDRVSCFLDMGFAPNGFLTAPEKPVWTKTLASQSSDLPSDVPICSFAAAGNCPRGQNCPHIHGDLCSICGKHCLHPYRHQEREEHVKTCKKREKYLEALKYSQEVECSVCLERILSKPTASERKFGVLSECDHPFCVLCIRNWRSNSPSYGMDVNSTLRACPICRKLSYFVIPSVIWYSTKEEKEEIIEGYRTKLRSIDCKHFDFGNGTCPFGASCFYKHAYRDGRMEEVVLHHLEAEDGHTLIAKDIRLSEFLSNLRLR